MFRVSLPHFYAVHGGSGAYLSQPTLTGRFLISSHCQQEHLRRLLPPVTWNAWDTEKKGWKKGKRGGKGYRVKGAAMDKGGRWEVISQTLWHYNIISFSLISFLFNVMPDAIGERVSMDVCSSVQDISPIPGFTQNEGKETPFSPMASARALTSTLLHLIKSFFFLWNRMEVDALH